MVVLGSGARVFPTSHWGWTDVDLGATPGGRHVHQSPNPVRRSDVTCGSPLRDGARTAYTGRVSGSRGHSGPSSTSGARPSAPDRELDLGRGHSSPSLGPKGVPRAPLSSRQDGAPAVVGRDRANEPAPVTRRRTPRARLTWTRLSLSVWSVRGTEGKTRDHRSHAPPPQAVSRATRRARGTRLDR